MKEHLKSFLRQCNVDVVNTEEALTLDPLPQEAFACEIPGEKKIQKFLSNEGMMKKYIPKHPLK